MDFLANIITIAQVILGLGILIMGRKLYRLFVAVVGFIVGLGLGSQISQGNEDWVILIVSLVGGVLGFILVTRTQKLALRLAGFLGGGAALISLFNVLGFTHDNNLVWVGIFIGGGIVGAILILSIFDIALIIISSALGALVTVQAFSLELPYNLVVFLVLISIGFYLQYRGLKYDAIPGT